jgi:hypothetical protein
VKVKALVSINPVCHWVLPFVCSWATRAAIKRSFGPAGTGFSVCCSLPATYAPQSIMPMNPQKRTSPEAQYQCVFPMTTVEHRRHHEKSRRRYSGQYLMVVGVLCLMSPSRKCWPTRSSNPSPAPGHRLGSSSTTTKHFPIRIIHPSSCPATLVPPFLSPKLPLFPPLTMPMRNISSRGIEGIVMQSIPRSGMVTERVRELVMSVACMARESRGFMMRSKAS